MSKTSVLKLALNAAKILCFKKTLFRKISKDNSFYAEKLDKEAMENITQPPTRTTMGLGLILSSRYDRNILHRRCHGKLDEKISDRSRGARAVEHSSDRRSVTVFKAHRNIATDQTSQVKR